MSIENLQQCFFQTALEARSHITVHLLNGVKVSGKIRCFDKYSLVLETTTLEQLIFKHSISAAFLCKNRHCPECASARNIALTSKTDGAA